MNPDLPTSGQLERKICQGVHRLYRETLGHSPDKVVCQIFGTQLAVVVEGSLTMVEKTVAQTEPEEKTAEKLNTVINDALKLKLAALVEELLEVEVEDILSDSTLNGDRTGTIITLSQLPQVRNPESIPKSKIDGDVERPDGVDPSEAS